MYEVTPEIIYSTWHKEIFLYKNIHVKQIKNFDKAKQKPEWQYFVACASLINRNNGMIDYLLYIRSLVEFAKGYVNPQLLTNRQSLRIYKNYVEKIEQVNDVNSIKINIENSIKFIVNYCIEKKIPLSQYFVEDFSLIPTFLKHINSGAVSKCFVACLPDFLLIMGNYPQDVINDFFIDFEEVYKNYRCKFTTCNELKHFLNEETINKISNFIDKKINKNI